MIPYVLSGVYQEPSDMMIKEADNLNNGIINFEELVDADDIIAGEIDTEDLFADYTVSNNKEPEPDKAKEISGYSLIQVNKILREDGAGSYTEYTWKNDDGNQVVITEKDSRFFKYRLSRGNSILRFIY